MIARQRVNLSRTFAHAEDKVVEDEVANRLRRFEEELATATTEFADGVARTAGPVPVTGAWCLSPASKRSVVPGAG